MISSDFQLKLGVFMNLNPATIPSKSHFHIRWVLSDKIDWERHDTQPDAEASAKLLAQRSEEFAIEQFNGDCPKCPSATK
jgi:hypothetical protein